MFSSPQEKAITLKAAFWFQFEVSCAQTELAKQLALDLLPSIHLIAPKLRHHRGKEVDNLVILLLNFVLAKEYGGGWLAIHSNKNRYPKTDVSYRVVHYLVEAMKDLGWLTKANGFYNEQELFTGLVARYHINESLSNRITDFCIEHQQVTFKPPNYGVVLKDSSKKITLIPKSLRSISDPIAKRLALINKRFDDSEISLSVTPKQWSQLAEELKSNNALESSNPAYVLTKKKYLRRTFNRGSFNLGGRFYGGWWQQIPTQWREYLTIDGASTVELDYSALHIRMLYGQKVSGHSGLTDPYQITGIDPSFRSVTKLIFLIIINAADRRSALATIKRDRVIAKLRNGKHPMGLKNFDSYLSLIEEEHHLISDMFYSDQGIHLQNIDADIAESVMLRMYEDYKCISLPVHDSFIVAKKYESALKEVMIEEFTKRIPAECVVKRSTYDKKIKLMHMHMHMKHGSKVV